MPPNAPPSCKKAGSRIKSAGRVTKISLRSSSARPTRVITVPVRASIGKLSARMRLRLAAPNRKATPTTTAVTTMSAAARTFEKIGMPIRYVVMTSAGRVRISPAAVSMGAAMLSMSHPRETERRATKTVMPSRSTPARMPPTVEMTT